VACYDEQDFQLGKIIYNGLSEKKGVYVLSYGGGINSSALFFYLINNDKPIDLILFADTGEELESTYKSVVDIKKICVDKNIKFVTVRSGHGTLYDYYFKKKAVPSMMFRDCTTKFKVIPIRKYLRTVYSKDTHFFMYIGICYDEKKRVSKSDVKYMNYIYPFVYDEVTRFDNEVILKEEKFVAFKSGCKGCIYNKKKNWILMFQQDKNEFNRWLKLEENNSGFPRVLLNGTFPLRLIQDNWKNQKTLGSFCDVKETCQNYQGGCFL